MREPMKIFVDADACPKMVKEILFRAAMRTKTLLILVSNHALSTPASPYISKMQVMAGFDVADNKILDKIEPGDLIITGDIPFADAVISKACIALNPRGELYTEKNIKERLALRNLSTDLRSTGMKIGGSAGLSKVDIQRFANALDVILSKR